MDVLEILQVVALIVAGSSSIIIAAFKIEKVWELDRVQFLVGLLTETGARLLLTVISLLLIWAGIMRVIQG